MGTSVIDAFLVTLGLDGSAYKKGMEDAAKQQDALTENTEKNLDEQDKAERQVSAERAKRAKEEAKAAKERSEQYKTLRRDVLALLSVFTLGAGIKSFITDAVNSAVQLGYLSQNLDLSTQKLQAWQRASERAGGSAEGITAQLKESADTLAQLGSGLGPNEGLQWFFRMGGSSDDLKNGNSYLLARSKIISDLFKTDPTKAMLIAKQMGIGEDQFDFLKQGPEAVQALVAAQEKNSSVTAKSAEDALRLKNEWLDFTQAIEATTRTVLLTLAPAITAVLGEFAKWADQLGQNKAGIRELGENVREFIRGVDWREISAGAKDFAGSLRSIAESLKLVIDRWDEFTGRSKVQTPGVTKTAGAFRFGKTEDLDADNKRTGKPIVKKAEPKTEAGKAAKTVSDGIDLALARTLASLGVQSAKEYVRDTMGQDLYGANQKPVAEKKDPAEGFDMFMARTLASLGVQSAKEHVRDTLGQDLYGAGPKKPRAPAVNVPMIPGGAENKAQPVNAQEVIKKLTAMGWTDKQAAGITASFIQESDLDPAKVNKLGMYGIGQWNKARRADFKEWAGKDIKGSSLDEQLRFFQHEVTKGKEQPAGAALRATKTPEEAAKVHSEEYERPGAEEANVSRRQRMARELDQQARSTNAAAVVKMPVGAPAAAPVSNDNRKTSTSTTEVKVGQVTINTQATDATSIAREFGGAVERYSFTQQANSGLS